ncbi:MAG: sterol desaturase family protein [Candidatus Limnocylindria bacterium]|jgi:lathosterol oxidase
MQQPPPSPAREFELGDGRLSGALSLGLGALSLFAVLCFRFPELLTTPELRAVYPLALVRATLFAALALALGLGALSVLLGERKKLGWGGTALAGAAIALGGPWIESGPVDPSPHLGLDWFVLDLLVLALVFVPLERAFARLRSQRILRLGWRTDLAHFFVSHLLVQVLALLTIAPAGLLFGGIVSPRLQAWVAGLPLPVQFVAALTIADLFQYGVHRAFHAVPWLWRFHAIHHSSPEMDWLAGSRLHLFDVVATRSITFVPLFVLGFAPGALMAYLVFVAFQAVALHANLRFELAWLRGIFATPAFHHWHHAVSPVDKNFAIHLPVIDRLFGTAWEPGGFPERYGTLGDPVPEGWGRQLVWPLRRSPAQPGLEKNSPGAGVG